MIYTYNYFKRERNSELKKLIKEYNTILKWEKYKHTRHNELFREHCDRNLRYQRDLAPFDRFFIEINEDLRDTRKKLPSVFNIKVKEIDAVALEKIWPNLIMVDANTKFIDYMREREKEFSQPKKVDVAPKSFLKWGGANKTEFVGFVYALYEAKYLTGINGEGITKIVNELAEILNYDLGKDNWPPLHDKSIKNPKEGYDPPVMGLLDSLSKAYLRLRKENLDI